MPWFVISTFDYEDVVTWRAVDTPFKSLDDAWDAVTREVTVFDEIADEAGVTGSVHVIEAKSVSKALDALDLPV